MSGKTRGKKKRRESGKTRRREGRREEWKGMELKEREGRAKGSTCTRGCRYRANRSAESSQRFR